MENPFDGVFETLAVKKNKSYKLNELLEFFPEESSNTTQIKKDIAKTLTGDDREIFCLTQMFINKFFYGLEYESEENINKIIEKTPEFEMFKTI